MTISFSTAPVQRFGIWYSRPGNGISHPVQMERFGIPGKTLLGSDNHVCAAGALEVAQVMAGEPFYLKVLSFWGVGLTGELPDWVNAKDFILEMLRRHGVSGGIGRIIEDDGPGLACLCAMDRRVITNMGAELGGTTTVFPSDSAVRRFLASQEREGDWRELTADADATLDIHDEIDLAALEPLIACPTGPDNVVPVREVAGRRIY